MFSLFTKPWRDDPIFIGINRLVAKGLVIVVTVLTRISLSCSEQI